ncbi:MAG: molybdopterin cofactor-binding domain-containing protein [Pseudomonadota bacterium]
MGKILRRTFLIGSAAIVGGVAFGAYTVNKDYPNPLAEDGALAEGERALNPYIKVMQDGGVTIMIPRAEMGQGITTTLAALVAEELDVPLEAISTEIAPASYAYYNAAMMADGAPVAHFNRTAMAEITRSTMGTVGKVLGLQVTGGSSSIADAYDKMREAGAAARETFRQAAANRAGVAVDEVKTEAGSVVLPDGTKLSYGELAKDAANLTPPSKPALRTPDNWSILGKSQQRKDAEPKSTGTATFGIDVDLPDMAYATVRMNPRLGGRMNSFDATEAKTLPGVIDVIDMTGPESEAFGGGFAVIAENTWTAFRAAELVEADWGPAPYPATTDGIMQVIEKILDDGIGQGDNLRNDGDVDLAFADAPRDRIVEARYQVQYLAHATMEPMNATAQFKDATLDVWTGTQAPTIVRSDCAKEVGLDDENVRVHSTFLGGGFGRRGEVDFPRFAARVARRADGVLKGRPVQVVWTREEDMTHDTYRPAAISQWRARLGDDGLPVALDGHIACPSVIASVIGRTFPGVPAAGPDNTITHGAFDQPYGIENYRVSGIKAPVDIPIGFWRAVGNSYNGFFHESFMDEMAHAADQDPMAFRAALMKDHPTAVGVMKRLAEISGWTEAKQEGRAKGCAFTLSFGCWTGQVVEVSQQDDGIRIENVWCVGDIGQALDPANVAVQLQSGIVYGLSSALGQEITFEDGMVQETNFDTYDAMRMTNCPTITVEVMEEAEHRGGAGEPGTPPSVAALANAVFALTGKRIRQMPLSKEVEFV